MELTGTYFIRIPRGARNWKFPTVHYNALELLLLRSKQVDDTRFDLTSSVEFCQLVAEKNISPSRDVHHLSTFKKHKMFSNLSVAAMLRN